MKTMFLLISFHLTSNKNIVSIFLQEIYSMLLLFNQKRTSYLNKLLRFV